MRRDRITKAMEKRRRESLQQDRERRLMEVVSHRYLHADSSPEQDVEEALRMVLEVLSYVLIFEVGGVPPGYATGFNVFIFCLLCNHVTVVLVLLVYA